MLLCWKCGWWSWWKYSINFLTLYIVNYPCSYANFSIHVPSSSILNVESVHMQVPNISNVDVSQLVAIEAQVVSWRPHYCLFICWGFFFYQWWFAGGFGETTSVVVHNLQIWTNILMMFWLKDLSFTKV
jgi:hypothetical protein